jgi:hypothetical protein
MIFAYYVNHISYVKDSMLMSIPPHHVEYMRPSGRLPPARLSPFIRCRGCHQRCLSLFTGQEDHRSRQMKDFARVHIRSHTHPAYHRTTSEIVDRHFYSPHTIVWIIEMLESLLILVNSANLSD